MVSLCLGRHRLFWVRRLLGMNLIDFLDKEITAAIIFIVF